jgi:hypothetical protein
MNIEVHIERLILEGLNLEPRERRLRAAVEAELARLLSTEGLRAELLAGGAMRSLAAPEIHVPPQIAAPQLGAHIAQAVHGSIGNVSTG